MLSLEDLRFQIFQTFPVFRLLCCKVFVFGSAAFLLLLGAAAQVAAAAGSPRAARRCGGGGGTNDEAERMMTSGFSRTAPPPHGGRDVVRWFFRHTTGMQFNGPHHHGCERSIKIELKIKKTYFEN